MSLADAEKPQHNITLRVVHPTAGAQPSLHVMSASYSDHYLEPLRIEKGKIPLQTSSTGVKGSRARGLLQGKYLCDTDRAFPLPSYHPLTHHLPHRMTCLM